MKAEVTNLVNSYNADFLKSLTRSAMTTLLHGSYGLNKSIFRIEREDINTKRTFTFGNAKLPKISNQRPSILLFWIKVESHQRKSMGHSFIFTSLV